MPLFQSFRQEDGQLYCEDVPLMDLAHQVGTPCYVYSRQAVLENFRSFRLAFQALDPLICFSVKANSNLHLLRLLEQEGSCFDVVSGGELHRLLRIGVEADRIVFSGVGKTIAELEMALEMSLLSLNVESVAEMETLVRLAGDRGPVLDVSLRINPDVSSPTHPYVATGGRGHKFGIDLERLDAVISLLEGSPRLRLAGLGSHIGSQILDMEPFQNAFLQLKSVASRLARRGLQVEYLDLGGGIGIPYRNETPADLDGYARFLAENREGYRILFEPGRYIVGNAGVLISQVLYQKTSYGKRFLIVDGAMNDLIRPALYQAHHEILPLRERGGDPQTVDVVGPVCETADSFAQQRTLPPMEQGDYLALMNAGAYGFVAASNYNSRPRPPEVLVNKDRFEIIRRRESLDDLMRGEE